MRYSGCLSWLAVCLAMGVPSALGFEPLSGTFVAESACIATVRIRDRSGVALQPGASYRLLGANRTDATHFQIRLPDSGGDRWVPVSCGHTLAAGGEGGGTPGLGRPREYVLAVSWQPAFCEGHADKPECVSQSDTRFDASNFTLHGLWPQPRSAVYCGVDAEVEAVDRPDSWHLLPPVELSVETRAALDEAMPGTQSSLDRHEWIKHGTCYGPSQEEYFAESLSLLRQLNESAVRTVFAGRIGGEVTAEQLAQAFDASFGAGAGERVTMGCARDGRRDLVVELRLNLAREIAETGRLTDLLAAAPEARAECAIGVIDPVGLQ
jgi:ribonuclease T2